MTKIKSKYSSLSYSERQKIVSYKIIKTEKILSEILNLKGFKPYNTWGGYCNGTLGIYISSENGTIRPTACTISYINSLSLINKETRYNLGYKGYASFGEYIVDEFIKRFGKFTSEGRLCSFDSNGYADAEWEEFFKQEFIKCIDDTNIRITKKQKTKAVKDRIQNIENEIDFAIIGYAEENADKGITIRTNKAPTQASSIEWILTKRLDNYGGFHGPSMTIRKNINGTYSIMYLKINTYNNYYTLWKKLNKDITETDMNNILSEYFNDFLNIPSTINITYTTLDNLCK